MSKSYKILIGLLLLLLGVFVYLESSRPEPVDWTPTYSIKDKIPYGTYVFYESLKKTHQDLQPIKEAPFDFLEDSEINGSYVFVNSNLQFSEATVNRFKEWVKKGNTLLLTATYTTLVMDDSLKLKTKTGRSLSNLKTLPNLNLVNPNLKEKDPYRFNEDMAATFFSSVDTLHTTLLGEISWVASDTLVKKEANFIEIALGEGKILLHTSPFAFTNIFMLQDQNYEYAEKVLAYLPADRPIYFDVYHDRGFQTYQISPLFVLLNNRYLKWGYYFLIIGAVLFILFEGKRKQKAIRIIPPLQNTSYEYTRTISGLYLDAKDHAGIAQLKIQQFLEFIRTELQTPTSTIDQSFYKRLEAVTDNNPEAIKELFAEMDRLRSKGKLTKQDLLSLNEKINDFKKNC